MQDWGITPEQAVDFQTLVGDAVDNVKGVPGIGPKTASALLQQYKTLDNLLAHVDEIPGKKQENLRASVEILKTTRQLVQLNLQVPIKCDWDHWRLQSWDSNALRDLFNAWGMRGFARQVPASSEPSNGKTAPKTPRHVSDEGQYFFQGTLFGEEEYERRQPAGGRKRPERTARNMAGDLPPGRFVREIRFLPR